MRIFRYAIGQNLSVLIGQIFEQLWSHWLIGRWQKTDTKLLAEGAIGKASNAR